MISNYLTDEMVEVKEEKISPTESNFRISPLFTGMGHSVGNAIRRTLLSVVKGVAITKMQISINNQPVKHLFTTLPPVIEDFLEISMRIKNIELGGTLVADEDMEKYDKIVLNTLAMKGPLYASSLVVPPHVKLFNKDLLLFTLSKDAMVNIEFHLEESVGYRKATISPEDENKVLDNKYIISLDSIFSKVVRVNYSVRDIVAGRYSGMDELVVNIKTKLSTTPRSSFDQVVDILIHNFKMIGSSKEDFSTEEEKENDVSTAAGDMDKADGSYSDQPISVLKLSTRASNCLHANNIHSLKQLKDCSFQDLMKINNLGSKSINEIIERLKELNIILS